jgi:hypothetical protein
MQKKPTWVNEFAKICEIDTAEPDLRTALQKVINKAFSFQPKESTMTPVPDNIAGDEQQDEHSLPAVEDGCDDPHCDYCTDNSPIGTEDWDCDDSEPEPNFFNDQLLISVRTQAIKMVLEGGIGDNFNEAIRIAGKVAEFILFNEIPEPEKPRDRENCATDATDPKTWR